MFYLFAAVGCCFLSVCSASGCAQTVTTTNVVVVVVVFVVVAVVVDLAVVVVLIVVAVVFGAAALLFWGFEVNLVVLNSDSNIKRFLLHSI